jgi:hypothetical protein
VYWRKDETIHRFFALSGVALDAGELVPFTGKCHFWIASVSGYFYPDMFDVSQYEQH